MAIKGFDVHSEYVRCIEQRQWSSNVLEEGGRVEG